MATHSDWCSCEDCVIGTPDDRHAVCRRDLADAQREIEGLRASLRVSQDSLAAATEAMKTARDECDEARAGAVRERSTDLRHLAQQPPRAEEPLSSFRICLVCDDQWRVSLSTPTTRAEQSVCFKCWQKAKAPVSPWRLVTEVEPSMGCLVLLSFPRLTEPYLGWRSPSGWTAKTPPSARTWDFPTLPSHWMPLPEGPAKEKL